MHSLKLKTPLVCFDLETTGINIAKDRIVELSFLKAMPNGEIIQKTRRINPEMPIPIESSLIHGIYDEDVKDEMTFKQVAKSLSQFIEGCDLAGFNILRFDVPMLVEEFLRAGIDFEVGNRKIVDAQRIYHLMEPRNLSAAYAFYCKKDLEDAHTAEADTTATFEVLNAQIQHYETKTLKDDKGNEYFPVQNDMSVLHELTASKMVDFAQRMIFNAQGIEVFNFGKHKNIPVTEALKKEPTYYEWMMNGDFPLDTKRKLTQIKLRSAKINK
ncbi:MAG: 3'-5' exonuclease [Cytophagia bacterium]|nr:MAG: 3'-5' exonuclease [Cytophagales bacterium]TAG02105.1 MAG: 3'-5' exonuclease [Cytophagia bacterium]TAG43464.1 MAG: 3'-5' exonuclease [Cytophagia bacterium]TAH28720.1 MAG: 3'-5' exonuclease [Cytophagales bacterium]